MIRLTVRLEGGPSQVLEFDDQDDVLVGRSDEAQVRLDTESVSRRHARLQLKDGAWRLSDLGAANGVFVQRGGVPPQTRAIVEEISSGDVICIEKFRITFEVVDGSALKGPPSPPDADSPPSFGREAFTRVTTLPRLTLPQDAAPTPAAAGPQHPGSNLSALLALSGEPVTRRSRSSASAMATVRPVLEISQGEAEPSRRLDLGTAPVQFGSDAACDVHLPGFMVPRYVATAELQGTRLMVRAVGSRLLGPKLTVDGKTRKDVELEPGGTFMVGPYTARFLMV